MKNFFLITAAIAVSLVACNKNSDILNNTGTPVQQNAPKNIMRFDSYEALSTAIDRSLEMAMNPVMRAPGQGTTDGFVSFGELADMAYDEVAQYQDDYKSIEEVKAAIANHSDYLQLIQDEDGEYSVETKLYRSATRYIVNEDKMYQVKDTLVKTLENYTVLTPENNYSELLKINETNIKDYMNNSDFLIYADAGTGNSLGGTNNGSSQPPSNSREFIRFEQVKKIGGRDHRLRADFYFNDTHPFPGPVIYVEPSFEVTHMRKGLLNLVYWTLKTNITVDLSAYVYGAPDVPPTQQLRKSFPLYAWRINQSYILLACNVNLPHPVFVKTRGFVKTDNLYVGCDFN